MSGHRAFLILKECDICGAEAIENDPLVPDGPPVVEENFQRSPHRDPAADDQTLADQQSHPVGFERTEHLADRQSYAQESKTYEQTDSALFENLRELAPGKLGLVGKKQPNRFLHHGLRWSSLRGVLDVDLQFKRRMPGGLRGAADDPFLH